MPLSSAPSLTPSDPPPRGASSTAESGCLHELVWAQAQRTPDATAVTCAGGDLSYADLVARAAAVASELRAHGVGAGAIVAVAVSRGPDLVPALLGVLASGAAWTALDARQPAARLRWLIDDAQPAVILVDAACAESVSGAGPPRLDVAHILRSAAPGRAVSLVSPGSGVGPRDVAALIYTSGSTGAPKGALLEHDGLVRLVTNWSQVPGLAADDVVLGLSSAAFDMAILDVFLPLSLGARLVLADERTTADGAALARLAESQGATFILATPSTWRLLLAGELRPRGRLRGVAGGEALTPELAGALLALGVELFNGYGVTEASACSCIARVTDPTGPISVGAPSPGVRVDILDDAGAPVADGGIGELWIGGRGVARGYHRRPELTAAYFSAASSSPDGRRYRTGDMARREVDGRITLHGRRDDQVKVRGHRVELGEVEACLLADAEVREACVFSVTGRGGEVALVAVVVAEDGVPDGVACRARARLNELLPAALVPASVHVAARLDRMPSGKVDRSRLARRFSGRPASLGALEAPAPGLEARVASLVAEVLGVSEVGATDAFVASGGTSLAATRLVQRLRDELALEVSLVDVLEAGSPRDLARDAHPAADGSASVAPPVSPEETQVWFAWRLDPDSPAYHTAFTVEIAGPLQPDRLVGAWRALLLRHTALRTRWVAQAGSPLAHVDPEPDAPLALDDLSGLPPRERDARVASVTAALLRQPFDLAAGHPVRARLFCLGPEDHCLVACVHHIAADGACLPVIQADLAALYDGASLAELPPAAAAPLAAAGRSRAVDFWRERLPPAPHAQAIAHAEPLGASLDPTAATWPLSFDSAVAEAISSLAQRAHTTPFTVLLAALSALLRAETGQGDLVVGTLLSGREQPERAARVGHFARTLALCIDADGEPEFLGLIARARATLHDALAHADLPFDEVVRLAAPVGHPHAQPLVQVVFAWQDPPAYPCRAGGVTFHVRDQIVGASPFDLLIQCWPTPTGFGGSLTHRLGRLAPARGHALAQRFQALVERVAAGPEAPAFPTDPVDEAAARRLRALPGVLDCQVGPAPRADGTVHRVAWVVLDEGAVLPSADGLHVQRVARIPLLSDGRPDRARLARPDPPAEPRLALHLDDLLGAAATRVPAAPPTAAPAPPSAAREPGPPALRHGPPLRMPEGAPATLPEALHRAALLAPHRGVHHIEADGSERFVPWPDLLTQASAVAATLQRRGVGPGYPVILVADRSSDFLAGLWGALLAGAVPVPLPASGDLSPGSGAARRLAGVFDLLERPPILAGEAIHAVLTAADLGLPPDRLWTLPTLATPAAPPAPVALGPDSPAIYLLTSGSTGLPKVVTHVHASVVAMLHAYGDRHALGPDDVFLNWLGLDHVAPLFMTHLSAVWHAATHVNAPTGRFVANPAAALDWASRFGATTTFAANFAFGLIAAAAADAPPGRWDLRRFRVIANGGETIAARTARRFVETLAPHGLPPTAMVPIWGMSETGSATITSLAFTCEDTDDGDPFVSNGDPIAGFSMRVVGADGAVVPEGQLGRLEVRGAQLHRGYHRRPDVDRETTSADGWFDTGDLAFITTRGMHIAGRAKDLIIVHGVNVYAHDVEAAVETVPGVVPSFTAACALRPEGADTDELVIAFVPVSADERELAPLCAAIRAAVARAAGVAVSRILPVSRETIPKTEIGKIQRPRLRAAIEAGELDGLHRRVEALCHVGRTVPNWFFEPYWRPRPLSGAAEPPTALLVIGGPEPPAGAPNLRWVSTRDPEHVRDAALQLLASPGDRPAILWRPAPTEPDPEAELDRALTAAGVLVALADALSAATDRAVSVLVLTHRAVAAVAGEHAGVAEAALLGLLASLRHEQPQHRWRHLDHDAESPDAAWQVAMSELAGEPDGEPELVYRGGLRQVRRLRRAHAPSAATPAERHGSKASPATQPSRWLITGGLGGVGLLLAAQLVERPGTRLLLVGRTAEADLPAERAGALAELRRRGEVWYAALDVADGLALAGAVRRCEAAWGAPLDGIAHLAAVMDSGVVARLDAGSLRRALAPRLLGTLATAALLEERPEACWFDHSSVNALFGGFGAGAYSAGARVGLAVTASLRARGRAATWLGWSRWADRGVTRGLALDGLAERRGYLTVDATSGQRSMALALREAPAAWLVGLDDRAWPVRRLLEAGPLHVEATPAPALSVRPAGSGGEAQDDTQRRVAAIWRDLLGAELLGLDDRFFDVGGHSILLARLQARLEADFAVVVPMMVLFEEPTIRRQAAWLSRDADRPAPPIDPDAASRAVRQRHALTRGRGKRRST